MWSPARRLQLDTHPFPIVVVTFHDQWSSPDLVWLFCEFELLFKRGQRYALVIDTTRANNPPNLVERKLITDWENVNAEAIVRCNVGTSVVFTSALIRGSLTALGWLVHRKKPVVYLPSTHEAARWCVERLREADVALSSEARGYLFTRGVDLT
jgi:hypothetical protein